MTLCVSRSERELASCTLQNYLILRTRSRIKLQSDASDMITQVQNNTSRSTLMPYMLTDTTCFPEGKHVFFYFFVSISWSLCRRHMLGLVLVPQDDREVRFDPQQVTGLCYTGDLWLGPWSLSSFRSLSLSLHSGCFLGSGTLLIIQICWSLRLTRQTVADSPKGRQAIDIYWYYCSEMQSVRCLFRFAKALAM